MFMVNCHTSAHCPIICRDAGVMELLLRITLEYNLALSANNGSVVAKNIVSIVYINQEKTGLLDRPLGYLTVRQCNE